MEIKKYKENEMYWASETCETCKMIKQIFMTLVVVVDEPFENIVGKEKNFLSF